MLTEAQGFWEAISGKVRQLIRGETKNTFKCERYEVTTAPNGAQIGVTLPYGSNEIFLPYSDEVSNASVGDQVLVVWWGSMSNAKVYYFADGYTGLSVNELLDLVYPIGSIYMSVNSTSPAALFGGTWEQIKDTFLLAAGDTYTAGDTGGEAEHRLTTTELPSNMGKLAPMLYPNDGTTNGIFSIGSQRKDTAWSSGSKYGTAQINVSGGNQAHNNMPPYLVVYVWKRVPEVTP